MVDGTGGLDGEGLEQCLIVGGESVQPVGVHVENASHFAVDFEGDG